MWESSGPQAFASSLFGKHDLITGGIHLANDLLRQLSRDATSLKLPRQTPLSNRFTLQTVMRPIARKFTIVEVSLGLQLAHDFIDDRSGVPPPLKASPQFMHCLVTIGKKTIGLLLGPAN